MGQKMATQYTYFDGKPIVLKKGIHGLGSKFEGDEQFGYVRVVGTSDGVYPIFVTPDQSMPVSPGELVSSRQYSASTALCTFDQPAIVEFISFGYSHRYYLDHYPEVASHWRDNLFTEARVLARSIQGNQAIAYEFLEGDGTLGGWLSHCIRGAQDTFRKRPIPKPENFDPLMERVWATSHKVKSASAAEYALLHDAGIEFMRIRYEQAQMTRQIRGRVEELISSAEVGLTVSVETEKASFALLDLYGQARYSSDPAALAAYRCGVLMVRAAARYAGEKLADNSNRKALWEAGVIIRGDLSKAVSGLMSGYIKKGFANPSSPSATETFAEELVGIQIWLVFFTVDFYGFEASTLSGADKARVNEIYLDKLAPEFALQIFGAIVAIGLAKKLDGLPADSKGRYWLGKIGAALPVLVGAVVHEYVTMKKLADHEKRPFHEVFCSEVGWALVRIFKEVGTALAKAPIQSAMRAKMESDRESWNKDYWKALILSLKLQMADLNPDLVSGQKRPVAAISSPNRSAEEPESLVHRLTGGSKTSSSAKPLPWTQKVPRGQSGPDSEGNVGMNKFKPTAAEANPGQFAKPPKPSKAERKKVSLAKIQNIRAGEEFTKVRIEAELKLSADEVQRKWRSDFAGKDPHYMCAHCQFVSSKRSEFGVDHVWDIQHGGKADRWTKQEIDGILASNDPQALYEKGINSMLLCNGCNQGKNRKFDNAPGNIPKCVGFAYTKHDEDMNPDHIYGGRPIL
jgi:hypothetical protein